MRVAGDDPIGFVRVDKRIVEQSEPELCGEHRRNQLVDHRFGKHAIGYEVDDMAVTVALGQLDIDARSNGQRAGLTRIVSHMMAVGRRTIVEFLDRVVVGYDKALEAPFVAQHIA